MPTPGDVVTKSFTADAEGLPDFPFLAAPFIPRQERAAARTRVVGSAGLSLLLLSVSALGFVSANQNGPLTPAVVALLAALTAGLFGAVVSLAEWRCNLRLEALVHGVNSAGFVAAVFISVALSGDPGKSMPAWAGFAAFLPLAAGNVFCAAAARSQARRLARAETGRTLKNALAATAASTAVGYVFFAILSGQPGRETAFDLAIAIITGVTFLLSFILSCRALRIAISVRRLLR